MEILSFMCDRESHTTFTLRAQISLMMIYLSYWSNYIDAFPSILPFTREVFVLFNLFWIGGIAIHSHYRPRISRRYQASFNGKITAMGDLTLHAAACSMIYVLLGTILSVLGWILMGTLKWFLIPLFLILILLSSGIRIHAYLFKIKPIFRAYLTIRKIERRARKGVWGRIINLAGSSVLGAFRLYYHTISDVYRNPHTASVIGKIGSRLSKFIISSMMGSAITPSKPLATSDTNDPSHLDETQFETFDDEEPTPNQISTPSPPSLLTEATEPFPDISSLSREERRQLRQKRLADAPSVTQPVTIPTDTSQQNIGSLLNGVFSGKVDRDHINVIQMISKSFES